MRRILLLSLLLFTAPNLHAFTMPPVDLKFYGDIRVNSFYYNDSAEISGYGTVIQGYDINVGSTSYIGTKLSIGKLDGEIALQADLNDPIRVLFFTYDMQQYGKLTIGKDFTLAGYYFGQISDNNNYMRGYGTLNNASEVQIKYGIHGFDIAVVSRLRDKSVNYSAVVNQTRIKPQDIFPRVELGYKYGFKYGYVRAFVTYAYYSSLVFLNNGTNKSYGSNAFDVGLASDLTFDIVTLKLTAFYGYNAALFRALLSDNLMPKYNAISRTVTDVQSFGFAAATEVEVIADKLIVRAGVGYMGSLSKGFVDVSNSKLTAMDDELIVFAGVLFYFTPNFYIVPEIAYMDSLTGQNGLYEGARLLAGFQFNVAF